MISDRVDKEDSSSPLVICLSDSFESFLPCGIPNLHFNLDAIDHQRFDFEVDADRRHVIDLILGVDEAQHDVRLPHCCVPDYHHFGKETVLFLLSHLN